jgi:uncharacterized DUF497 family protein
VPSGSRPGFERDIEKSDRCRRERGFDFAYATAAFDDPGRRIEPDLRQNYGEIRLRLFGRAATVRQWERDGVPYGPIGTLFRLIDRAPDVAMAVLAA